jgi:tetratricopeptide (TPR) repeat protein
MKIKPLIVFILVAMPLKALAADITELRHRLETAAKPREAYPLWLEYGAALDAASDYAGAIDAYKNAVKALPKKTEGHMALAMEYEKAELFSQAASEYISALERDPKLSLALMRLASLYLREGFTSKAMECYIRALTLRPDTDTYRQTARCAEKMGNLSLAASMLRQALSKESVYDDNLDMGRVLLLSGDNKESERYLSEAVKLNPRMPDAYLVLGLLYEKMNNYILAEKMLQIAHEKAPDEGLINFFLAQLYYHQHNRPKALAEIAIARTHAKTQMLKDYSGKFEGMLEGQR